MLGLWCTHANGHHGRMTIPSRTLNDGHSIPAIGFGSYRLRGEEGTTAVTQALDAGYRLIDTASAYENEQEVGEGIRASGLPREQLFITTKLAGRHHGYDKTLEGFDQSRTALGLDFIDLYLIHWPLPRLDLFVESWHALVHLRDEGLVRSIGVSNFTEAHLTRLMDETGIVPAVNQVEMHPRFGQQALRAFHAAHGILTQAWSPLSAGHGVLDDPVIGRISHAHDVSPAQAVLRWHIQLGSVPIPKSGSGSRLRQNLDVFGFELTAAELDEISGLEAGRLWGGDPDTHEEF